MSDTQQSATGTSAANTPATATETDKQIQKAVAQVKEARAKEMSLKGMPELAKIFREDKKASPAAEAPAAAAEAASAAAQSASEATPPGGEAQAATAAATEKSEADKSAEEAAARRAARAKELSELARSGREKWQARQAEKQQRGEVERLKAEVEAERSRIAAEKAKLEAAAKDPLKFLESLGLPPEELAKQVIRRGDPLHKTEELAAQFEEFKRQQREAADADAKARAAQQERDRQAAQIVQARQAEAQFVRMASDQDKYPSLNALYSPEEILVKAHRVAQAARAADPNAFYEDSEIADHLESEAKARLEKLRGAPPAPAPIKTPEPPAETPGQSEPKGQKSRTLSSELQGELGVDTEAFKKLPRSKQNQIIGETLKRLTSRKS